MDKSQSKYFHTAARMDEAFLRLLGEKDFEYITVTEICAKAGVNRSTFYLHYETVGDLLAECVNYVNDHFAAYMEQKHIAVPEIQDCSLHELYFITPEYLTPYLSYIAEHKVLFRTVIKHSGPLGLKESYGLLFQRFFNPILERFQIPEISRDYLMTFYIHGLMAIVIKWLEQDCNDSIDHIIQIMQRCIAPYSGQSVLP